MFVKLSNKFIDKYDMWVDIKDLEKVNDPDERFPSVYKVDLIAWCHEPETVFGVKFLLKGCWIVGPGKISYDQVEGIQ